MRKRTTQTTGGESDQLLPRRDGNMRCLTLVVVLSLAGLSASDFFPERIDPLPALNVRKPRFIRFHSRPPGPDAQPQYGIGFSRHLANLFKGGKLGVEFNLPAKFDERMRRFGRMFPFLSGSRMKNKSGEPEKNSGREEESSKEKDKEWDHLDKEGRNGGYERLIDPRGFRE